MNTKNENTVLELLSNSKNDLYYHIIIDKQPIKMKFESIRIL